MSSQLPPDLPPALAAITLSEDWSCGIGGGIWSNGLILATYFLNDAPHLKATLTNKTCLELGSGNGWLATVLGSIVTADIICTDTAEHVPLMQSTITTNATVLRAPDQVTVQELLWGAQTLPDGATVDFIFGTDVAYRDYLHDPLIKCLSQHLKPTGTAIIGVCMHDTSVAFFDKLGKGGFVYERIRDDKMPERYRGMLFGLFVIQKA